jgi:predicted membrane chloride channel (bestrophin family)
VGIYSTAFSMALLPAWLPALPVVPMTAFQLTSFALSLLLVFRTNSSYGRWHEARASFGAINTTSRDIARQVTGWGVSGVWGGCEGGM